MNSILKTCKKKDLIAYGKVFYSEKNQIDNLNDLYLLKNSDWRYEEEYRQIIYALSKNIDGISYWEMHRKGQTNNLYRIKINTFDDLEIKNDMLFKLMLKYKLEHLYHYYFQTKKNKES